MDMIWNEGRAMVDIGTLLAHRLVVLGLFLIPGPAVLLTPARSMGGGKRVRVATGLGIASRTGW